MITLLIEIFVLLLCTGLLLWGVAALPYLDAGIKQLIRVIIIVIVGIWLILMLASAFGYGGDFLQNQHHLGLRN